MRAAVVVEWRKNQWSDASFDIAAFRRSVLDGPLAVADGSAGILSFSVSQAEVARDTSGSLKMHKASQYRRDDVAQAAVLSAGALGPLGHITRAGEGLRAVASAPLIPPKPPQV